MKKLKLNRLNLGDTEVLSREQLKKVLGGLGSGGGSGDGGTRCAVYCCDSGGDCIAEGSYNMSCTSNEQCQSWAVGNGASCSSGYYIAALCKG